MNTQTPNSMLKNKYLSRWKGGSWAIFCVAAFSVVNILMFLFGSDSYVLFTAYIPYLLGVLGVAYLKGIWEYPVSPALGAFLLSVTAVFVILYFVFWFFSKKKVGWLIAGTVFFAIDTAFVVLFALISGDFVSLLVDILFHILALVEMILGVTAAFKLKKLPEEAAAGEISSEQAAAETVTTKDQPGISDEFKN